MGNDQTYVCCAPTETPRNVHLKYTKCLLLHLLIFCVLCVICDTFLPQTSWWRFFFFGSPQTRHLHFKHVTEMAPASAAVTVWQTSKGCLFVWHKQNIHLGRYHLAACGTCRRCCRTNGRRRKPESVGVNSEHRPLTVRAQYHRQDSLTVLN